MEGKGITMKGAEANYKLIWQGINFIFFWGGGCKI
jgi:hypothetical protein